MKFVELSNRGASFLGVTHPILCGAMSWISNANLVAAISNAGGFGVIACGAMSPIILRDEIKKTYSLTKNNFAVNLILMHPQLKELVEVCREEKVKYVIFAGGIVNKEMIDLVHSYGAKAIAFAPSLLIAKNLVKNSIDALIIEGNEAGGHIGPVATSVLVQEILPYIKEVPIFVAGGIGSGEMIANYMLLGAAGCQLGTRFVCAEESIAHPNFKDYFIKANSRDAVSSIQLDEEFPVIPVRALKNKAMTEFLHFQKEVIANYKAGVYEKKEAALKIEHFWVGALRKAVIDGDINNGSLMAGQSVGMVKKIQTASEIINELVSEGNKYLDNLESRYI